MRLGWLRGARLRWPTHEGAGGHEPFSPLGAAVGRGGHCGQALDGHGYFDVNLELVWEYGTPLGFVGLTPIPCSMEKGAQAFLLFAPKAPGGGLAHMSRGWL